MKRNIYSIALLALILSVTVSCRKDALMASGETVDFGVGVSFQVGTKAQTADEQAVSSLDVFVFRASDDLLEAHKRVLSSTSATGLTVTTGDKKVYCVVNASSSKMSVVTRPSQLDEFHGLFSENARNAFVMKGMKLFTVSASATSTTVDVRRDVAKVVLSSAPSFTGDMAGATLEAMYLINVPKRYSETMAYSQYDSDQMFNFRNAVATYSEQDALLKTTSWSTALYGYPNATPQASAASEEDYTTKLVLKVEKSGVRWWYPFSIPGMAANKVYTISSLTINRSGSYNPNEYPISAVASFKLSINEWEPKDIANGITSDAISY